MGHKDQRPLTQDDLKTALRKRDEQITCLEARVEAYIARTSETQARLLTTIDIVDSLKAQHIIDLAVKERERVNLSHETERWRTFAKGLEVERDDLKDVVEDLIQKVQISSDWSMWPCSRMDITKHLHQLPENHFKSSDTGCRHSEDIMEYGASVITRLRTELDHERKAHCKAVEEANLRISELEAKVAVREAELETSIRNQQKRELDRLCQPRNPESEIPPPKPMTDEDCLRVLADSNTRNKSLEIEIRSLARKLECTRGSAGSVVDPSSPPRIASPDRPHQPVIPRQPPTTNIEPHSTSTRNTVSTLPAGSDVIIRTSSHDSPAVSSTSASQHSIAQLDDQINTYASQLDAFKAERKTLIEMAVRKRRVSDGEPPDFPQILVIEEECVRLASQVSHLEQELEHSRSSAKSREQELLKEIDALKLSLHQQSPSLYLAHDVQHLDDGLDVEQNMELATPLQPTAILPWNNPGLTTLPIDPLLIPLPFSPKRNSSPVIPLSRPLPRPSSPHPIKLRRLEERLEVARVQLTAKEQALDQLKIDMEELRHLLPEEPP
ncbi:hypothetical protein DEU56DRAFT_292957 [Suillus clintonianus]|uniref:uncharacterized protein n=1 Tax=Suillus clintonianus TaxID=1904413 RepID=UPI001B866B48|nr:uncharacterized protein DEU56DRAFT_292957 [Suillus clintonianus]KAG2140094.1 hypothetical protein DEU56DRAFT_292957 [Suillus clintonianus]